MIHFNKSKVGTDLFDKYGIEKRFKVFRYAYRDNWEDAKARFVVHFQLENMSAKANKRFSAIPMLFLIRFRGFMAKYWLCDEGTGECMGVYHWKTVEDAERYSKSIAMRFMTKRSVEGSVWFDIISL